MIRILYFLLIAYSPSSVMRVRVRASFKGEMLCPCKSARNERPHVKRWILLRNNALRRSANQSARACA